VLAGFPDSSIDAIVTDPPYELGFMGKQWDNAGVAYDVQLWTECLRVLKPGGHLLAFGGTRTYHRMAAAIEDAGFEIRDSLHWVYGSGFPKSLDVSKAIDKRGGNVVKFEGFRDAVKAAMAASGVSRRELEAALGNYMLSHYLTAGSQPAVPNYRDYVIIRDTVHLGDRFDHLFADEAERAVVGKSDELLGRKSGIANGTKGHTTVGGTRAEAYDVTAPATDAARQWEGWGTALKPAHEPIVVARKPLVGTVAANVLAHGTGALNIDGCRVGTTVETWPSSRAWGAGYVPGGDRSADRTESTDPVPPGRWPANFVLTHTADCAEECVRGCPVALMDGQGGASRFFTVTEWDDVPPFRYVAKPSRSERNAGLDGLPERNRYKAGGVGGTGGWRDVEKAVNATPTKNHHPTVKPLALMRWLVRLVTPPGGVVLDPFAGSGTTLVAATLEGFDAVGVEMTDEYLPIIDGRLAWATQQLAATPPTLFDEEAS